MHIEVPEDIEITKENYIDCQISIDNTEEEYILETTAAKIKGRGNSTWAMPKKPYTIKFDTKTDIFGNGKAKKWILIANYCDKSLTRNMLAYDIGRLVGLSETTTCQSVNVFMNGVYQGVYLLCEQTEIGKTRLNIESDLNEIDTGYLLELDYHAVNEGDEDVDYFVIGDNLYALKDPEREDDGFTQEHFDFIKDYVTDCYNAVLGNDYQLIQNYIDTLSFAKCYIVHELFNCVDCGQTSFYIYKKAGDKLYAGPLWDFDISSGNCDFGTKYNDTEYLYAKEVNVWYNNLLRFEEFQTLVTEQLQSKL